MFDVVTPTVTITAPSGVDGNGAVAVLNDSTSGNFVGYGVELSRSAPIRQSKDNVPEGDGAVFGSQYYGEGQWTLTVMLKEGTNWTTSYGRRDKLFQATHAMRSDLTISWTESGGVLTTISARRAQFPQGPDEDGKVLIQLEGAKYFAYGPNNSRASATSHTFTPTGIYENYPTVTVGTPGGTVTLARTSPSPAGTLTFTGLSGGGAVTVDFWNKTITQGGVDKSSAISWPSSTWWSLLPGSSNVLAFSSAGSIDWRANY